MSGAIGDPRPSGQGRAPWAQSPRSAGRGPSLRPPGAPGNTETNTIVGALQQRGGARRAGGPPSPPLPAPKQERYHSSPVESRRRPSAAETGRRGLLRRFGARFSSRARVALQEPRREEGSAALEAQGVAGALSSREGGQIGRSRSLVRWPLCVDVELDEWPEVVEENAKGGGGQVAGASWPLLQPLSTRPASRLRALSTDLAPNMRPWAPRLRSLAPRDVDFTVSRQNSCHSWPSPYKRALLGTDSDRTGSSSTAHATELTLGG